MDKEKDVEIITKKRPVHKHPDTGQELTGMQYKLLQSDLNEAIRVGGNALGKFPLSQTNQRIEKSPEGVVPQDERPPTITVRKKK